MNGLTQKAVSKARFELTAWAEQNMLPAQLVALLQQGLFSIFETMSTKFLSPRKAVDYILSNVSKYATDNFSAFVVFLFAAPIFQPRALLLELAGFCLHGLVALLNLHRLLLGSDESSLKFDNFFVPSGLIAKVEHGLRNILEMGEARYQSANFIIADTSELGS